MSEGEEGRSLTEVALAAGRAGAGDGRPDGVVAAVVAVVAAACVGDLEPGGAEGGERESGGYGDG